MDRDVHSSTSPFSISSADGGITHLEGAMVDDFGEAVLAPDVPEPRELPSLDSCQKRILWAHESMPACKSCCSD